MSNFNQFINNNSYATVASHATTSAIWTAAGNIIDFTGTATITDFPAAPNAGAQRTLICAGACIFTHAGNITVQGATTFTASTGDVITVTAITTTTFKINISKQDGSSVIPSTPQYCDLTAKTTSGTLSAAELAGNVVIINTGSGAPIELTLQAGAADYSCAFEVTEAQYLKVTAAGTNKFRYFATEGAQGGYIRSNVVGTRWKITWSGGNWSIHDLIGTVLYDE